MKKLIDIDTWKRKDHFNLFSKFEEPFWGLVVSIDCTRGYKNAKDRNQSFFLYYLYRVLQATNEVENFRYRIIDGRVYLYDQNNVATTVNRPDDTFGFAYLTYFEDEQKFVEGAKTEIEKTRRSTGLVPSAEGANDIHFSVLPWLDFTSISHARAFSFPDSCPKISVGKMTHVHGKRMMPVSIHVHHGLADGYHVGLFVERFQELMNEN
ncbi:chloramphenicol acetyltransferase [Mucilaginibacter panaciglaebae]|uniref:Chloramphenicol acetyltransferase n=1 Tax=Mucilaginibacter panaciglaebae TaxID=502331 RepID=A0ABP7WRA1_9SPHI